MAVVKLIEADRADASLRKSLAAAEKHFGKIPNLMKALANNPGLCRPLVDFMVEALRPGRVDLPLKVVLILKTLRASKGYYGIAHFERLADELGLSAAKIGDLSDGLWRTSGAFTDGERALLELVEQVAFDANDVSDDLWKRLRAHWNAGQLLEINAVITAFLMIGKIGDALGVSDPVLFTSPPTTPGS